MSKPISYNVSYYRCLNALQVLAHATLVVANASADSVRRWDVGNILLTDVVNRHSYIYV